jgi:hypothetical protein
MPFAMTAKTTLGKFCIACQAIPQAGYCNLAGCPSRPPTDCPSPPQSDQVEEAQVDDVLREEHLTDLAWKIAFDKLSELNKANLRRLLADYDARRPVAALRPVTSHADVAERDAPQHRHRANPSRPRPLLHQQRYDGDSRMSTVNFNPSDRLDLRPDATGNPMNARIRLMSRSGGYVMVRKPHSVPFVLSEKEWARLPLFEAQP